MQTSTVGKIFLLSQIGTICLATPQTEPDSSRVSQYISLLQRESESRFGKATNEPLPRDQVKHYARGMFEALEENPIQTYRLIRKKNREFDSLYALRRKGRVATTSTVKVAYAQSRLKEAIESGLSKRVALLASTPWILKIRIRGVDRTFWVDPTAGRKLGEVDVTGTITSILKGHHSFTEHSAVKFYYMDIWRLNVKFDIGKEYLVLLEPRADENSEIYEPALVGYVDESRGCYPLEAGYLSDVTNTFGFGKRVSWKDFEVGIQDQIRAIGTW